jgi:hypothetical protein
MSQSSALTYCWGNSVVVAQNLEVGDVRQLTDVAGTS